MTPGEGEVSRSRPRSTTQGLSTPAGDPAGSEVGSTNPYLFVVGAARSGTSVLARMLDRHPDLAMLGDTSWVLRRQRPSSGLDRDGMVTEALIPQLLRNPDFCRLDIGAAELRQLLAGGGVRYDAFVSRVFDVCAQRRGKTLAGDRTPAHVRRISTLHTLAPHARIVHVIRDARDVCLSLLDWSSGAATAGQFGTWELDPLISCALYWRMTVGFAREAGRELGPLLYHEVHLEDLVADPPAELSRLCAFLELPCAREMAPDHAGSVGARDSRTPQDAGNRSGLGSWQPRGSHRDWRTKFDLSAVRRLELACGPLLGDLGYPVGSARVTDVDRRHVDFVRTEFTKGAIADGYELPIGWWL